MSTEPAQESARPTKIHRVVIDLHPWEDAALDRARRKFSEAHDGIEPRPSSIGKAALAKFCEHQGEPFPTLPRRALRPLPPSRYEEALVRLHAEQPELGPAALAHAVGCSLTSVRRILPDLPMLARGGVQLDLLQTKESM